MVRWTIVMDGPYVEVLEPSSLRERLGNEIGKMEEKYWN